MQFHRSLSLVSMLSVAAFLSAELTAQNGRIMTTLIPPVIASLSQYRVNYPISAAGNAGIIMVTRHQVGSVPFAVPGFTVVGSCLVDPGSQMQPIGYLLDSSGSFTLSLNIPSGVGAFLGFRFDMQSLDANFTTRVLTFSDNDLELTVGGGVIGPASGTDFVPIPQGTFLMGSTSGQPNEAPVHQVSLTQPIWIGKNEVTQNAYQALMGINPSFFQGPSYPNSGNRPVEQVSYESAVFYCNLLTLSERAASRVPAGYQYRLPTEAEWEYCCRAGTTTAFNTGATLNSTQANIANTLGQTMAVGSFASNPFGLNDTHGNVWEWCLDGWDGSINYPASALANPYVITGPNRVLRGGSFYDQSDSCRSSFRFAYYPSYSLSSIGFRVVLGPILIPVAQPVSNTVVISAGTFSMGSTDGQTNEAPVHRVTITHPFWMGQFEVTQAEYQAVMGINPSFHQGAGYINTALRPVERVNYNNAMAYCAALTTSERAAGHLPANYQYRLPTEAEWEYCCRAGTTTAYNTGSTLSTAQANIDEPISGQTSVVGSYPANAFGLYDTHGNVWEWCLDSWDGSINYPVGPVSDPYVITGGNRVLRGGSWWDSSSSCRSSYRYGYFPTYSLSSVGFRVVLALTLVQ